MYSHYYIYTVDNKYKHSSRQQYRPHSITKLKIIITKLKIIITKLKIIITKLKIIITKLKT